MHHRSYPAPHWRRLIIATFAFVLVAGALLLGRAFLTPHAASAAACSQMSGCSGPATTCLPSPGPQCTEQDPAAQGCVDPSRYGIASTDIWVGGNMVGRIDERYAPNCQSWWGRVFIYNYRVADLDWDAPIIISGNGITISAVRKLIAPGNRLAYTGMLYAPLNSPENFTITVWIRLNDGTLINEALKTNPVP